MRRKWIVPLLALSQLSCLDVATQRWEREATDFRGAPTRAWPEASPEEAGFDSAALESLARRIEDGELSNLHSLLVVRDGKLVFERYFSGTDWAWARPLGRVRFTKDTLHDLRSKPVFSSTDLPDPMRHDVRQADEAPQESPLLCRSPVRIVVKGDPLLHDRRELPVARNHAADLVVARSQELKLRRAGRCSTLKVRAPPHRGCLEP